MPDQSFCPECPRAFLCMNLHEECFAPLATCVLCGKVIALSIETEFDIDGLYQGNSRIMGREENPQLVPPRRTVCPRLWLFENYEIFPKGSSNRFTCQRCNKRGLVDNVKGFWEPTSVRRK